MSAADPNSCPYDHDTEPPEPLSKREAEVAWWISEGLKDGEIAHQLGIDIRTVDTHRDRILRKLQTRCRVGIAVWMVKKYHHLTAVILGAVFGRQ